MSSSYTRYPAKRVLAAEFNDGTHTFKESDEDRAPNFQLLPTGEKANRVLFAGTVTEVEDVGSDSEYYRARVVDPTGTVFVYAGQYEPEALQLLRKLEPPAYVIMSGKVKVYVPDDEEDDSDSNTDADENASDESESSSENDGEGDNSAIVSIRPKDFIREVDSDLRDTWVLDACHQTFGRIKRADPSKPLVSSALDQYGTEPGAYTSTVIDALESVDQREVESGEETEVESETAQSSS